MTTLYCKFYLKSAYIKTLFLCFICQEQNTKVAVFRRVFVVSASWEVVRSPILHIFLHFQIFFLFFHHFNPRPDWISSFYDLHQKFHSVLFVLFMKWSLPLKKINKNRTSWKSSFEAPCLEYSFLFVRFVL